MTELGNILPAMIGAILGCVAFIAARVSTSRLQANRKRLAFESSDSTRETDEPYLPIVGDMVPKSWREPYPEYMVVDEAGGKITVRRSAKGTAAQTITSR